MIRFEINRSEVNDFDNPLLDWQNDVKTIFFHKRYNLGLNHDYNSNNYNSWVEMEKDIRKREKPLAILPVYMYDHGGLSLSTEPFSCRFDSGQLGFIVFPKERYDYHFGKKKGKRKDVINILKELIKEYNYFINGEAYTIDIFVNGKHDETFFKVGEYSEMEKYAKEIIKHDY